ncbi:MAG: ComF family protein [Bacteroidetes bacterium]|nr:ComF family protein [Bacteroidota bacterium]
MGYNHICFLCSECSPYEKEYNFYLCIDCKTTLEQQFFNNIFKKTCPICCLPTLSKDNCVNCSKQSTTVIDNKQTCFSYTGMIKELITYYKFRNIIQISEIFSDYVVKALGDFNNHIIIIPIPGNPKNVQKRGWDQVLEIANRIKHERIVVHVLLKQKNKHKQQKTLDKSQRIIQAKNKYTIDKRILRNVIKELQSSGHYQVLLLDDIITTGATLESAAAVIINALNVPVHAITLAMD